MQKLNHVENNSSTIFASLLDGGRFSKEKAILEGGSKLPCTVKIRRFYGKIPGIWLPVHLPLFLRAFTCRTFLEIKIWQGYVNRQYSKKPMTDCRAV